MVPLLLDFIFWTSIFSKYASFFISLTCSFHCPHLLAFALSLFRASWSPFWAQAALSKTDLLGTLQYQQIVLDSFFVFVYLLWIFQAHMKAQRSLWQIAMYPLPRIASVNICHVCIRFF